MSIKRRIIRELVENEYSFTALYRPNRGTSKGGNVWKSSAVIPVRILIALSSLHDAFSGYAGDPCSA